MKLFYFNNKMFPVNFLICLDSCSDSALATPLNFFLCVNEMNHLLVGCYTKTDGVMKRSHCSHREVDYFSILKCFIPLTLQQFADHHILWLYLMLWKVKFPHQPLYLFFSLSCEVGTCHITKKPQTPLILW